MTRSRPLLALLASAMLASCNNDVTIDEVDNVAPEASIQFPEDLSEFDETDSIEFRGLVADANGLVDIQVVTWTSSLDGELASFSAEDLSSDGLTTVASTLSEGTHTITLEVADVEAAIASDSITVLVDAAAQLPVVDILAPANLSEVVLDSTVNLTGSVLDPNQPADTLAVEWTVEPASGGTATPLTADPTTSTGVTLATWTASAVGNYVIRLTATDDDLNSVPDEIALLVVDPDAFDGDGDGYSPNQGDCDDEDGNISPGADEACNNVDDDCNNIVDDKDLDSDAHVDDACTGYAGNLPVDDCDDGNTNIYGGAPELADGLDNDCDTDVDDGLPVWDADGDCFCVSGTCTGSVNASCVTLAEGDCDDTDALRFPGNVESTCTGIDEDCDASTPDAPDADNDGVTICDTVPDCDDNDGNNYPGNSEACDGANNDCDAYVDEDITNRDYWEDADGDGYGDPNSTPVNDCQPPSAAYVPDNTDCNDDPSTGADVNPGEVETPCNSVDDDCDSATLDTPDADGDGVDVCSDCDDDDPANFPGNGEVCDGADNDCQLGADNGLAFADYWPDVDGDGEGNSYLSPTNACASPSTGVDDRWVANGLDCDDTDADNFTTNTEVCDGEDQDCDQVADNGLGFADYWPDADEDGEGDSLASAVNACADPSSTGDEWVTNQLDCDDSDPANFSTNSEVCDGYDNDCNNLADDGLAFTDYYPDDDGDTYGDRGATPINACENPSTGPTDRWVTDNTDCNDTTNLANPGISAETTCDGYDNDCDTATLDAPDVDGDGVTICAAVPDCDDDDISNFPGNDEVCDGYDNDCDNTADDGLTFVTYYEDYDGDGYGNASVSTSECSNPGSGWTTNSTDCNDQEFTMNPGYAERCDGLNNDCDSDGVDEYCPEGLTVEPAVAASASYGGGGGDPFDDECPAGEVMIGIDVRALDRMDRVQAICAPILLVEGTSTAPYTYTVDRSASETWLPAYGGTGGNDPAAWRCPGDEVVIGIFGRSGSEVDNLQLQCGVLSVSGSTPGGYSISRSIGTTSPQWADNDGGNTFSYNCPSGQAVKWLWGRSGSRIDAIGVSCSEITVDQPL